MCGIAGFFGPKRGDLERSTRAMTDSLSYRGPDDEGIWCDNSVGIALGHRRLSILDLSPEGHQPMLSPSGRFVSVYNGEVYNYLEMQEQLKAVGYRFRGTSDTETMLAAFEEWGIESSTKRFIGMFAFAVWDRKERELILVRDRLGIKPLYYGWSNGHFFFASELKALRAHTAFDARISSAAVDMMLRFAYLPCPHSIYDGIYKLEPGSILSLRLEELAGKPDSFSPNLQSSNGVHPKPYWSLGAAVRAGEANPFGGSDIEACEELTQLLKSSVKLRMISDVPLGAFLSGGIDSSLVVALMQEQSSIPVKTFSIGFHEPKYNEAGHAKLVAQYLGTEHTELYVSPEEAMQVIPSLCTMYDEPFADSSQIPTYLVSKLARRHVTVSLSGDGGDELFCGYERYLWGSKIWQTLNTIPPWLRTLAANVITAVRPRRWDSVFGVARLLGSKSLSFHSPGEKLHKLSQVLHFSNSHQLYLYLTSHWQGTQPVLGAGEVFTPHLSEDILPEGLEFISRMMFIDTLTYLPDDILVKVDRASMAVSLEARVPILDHRVVEFSARLPLRFKLRRGVSKWILRQVLYRYVPQKLVDRPKMGFGVPIDSWLRGPLRSWAEDLLDEELLKRQGVLDAAVIRQRWQEHLSGSRDWQHHLWNVLMFQAWALANE